MYTYGDIIKFKNSNPNVKEYYIVTDFADFSDKGDGSDMVYEIMRIFPVAETSKMANVHEKEVELIGRGNSQNGQMIVRWVMEARAGYGWVGEPDFIRAIKHNQKANQLKKVLPPKLDEIRYDKLPDIDSCLDAMNDLEQLHEQFGDDAYLQLREVVIERLKYFVD